jgi:hypothetical protein
MDDSQLFDLALHGNIQLLLTQMLLGEIASSAKTPCIFIQSG